MHLTYLEHGVAHFSSCFMIPFCLGVLISRQQLIGLWRASASSEPRHLSVYFLASLFTLHLNPSIKGGTNPWFLCANNEATVPEGDKFVSESLQNETLHTLSSFNVCFQADQSLFTRGTKKVYLRTFFSSINEIGCNGPSLICSIRCCM